MILTFDSDHVLRLLAHSEAAPVRSPNLVQLVDPAFWRKDMDPERLEMLRKDAEKNSGLSFEAKLEDIDLSLIQPGLWLVGDHGVYLMSNGGDSAKQLEGGNAAYAHEVNPEKLPFEEWWENKRASFGGDDGCEFIDAETIRSSAAPGQPMRIQVNAARIEFLLPEAGAASDPSP